MELKERVRQTARIAAGLRLNGRIAEALHWDRVLEGLYVEAKESRIDVYEEEEEKGRTNPSFDFTSTKLLLSERRGVMIPLDFAEIVDPSCVVEGLEYLTALPRDVEDPNLDDAWQDVLNHVAICEKEHPERVYKIWQDGDVHLVPSMKHVIWVGVGEEPEDFEGRFKAFSSECEYIWRGKTS